MPPVIKKIGNDTKIDKILNRDCICTIRTGFVEIGKDKICLPEYYENYEEKIRNFEVHDDDVFILGFPKSGTTWTQEMVWLILNNYNFEQAKTIPVWIRSPQVEFDALFDFDKMPKNEHFTALEDMKKQLVPNSTDSFSFLSGMRRPRLIKSHLQWSLLPEQIQNGSKKPKIIILLRTPADVCVSYFYHSQSVTGYKGTFEDFCELFLHGRVDFGPFWKTVLSYWEKRDEPNILFVTFKEMKQDLRGVVEKITQFLGKSLTEDEISKLLDHLSFESMAKIDNSTHEKYGDALKDTGAQVKKNNFVRAGKVGGYKKEFSPELVKRFEDWVEENLAGTGLSFE